MQDLEASNSDFMLKIMRLETELQVLQKSQDTIELQRGKVCKKTCP